jgi:hypothetical protein
MRFCSTAVCVLAFGMAARLDAGQVSNQSAVVTATISRPVSSTRDLPALSFDARVLVRDGRPVPYVATVSASVDGAPYTPVAELQPLKGKGAKIDRLLPDAAARPGFHAVRARVDFDGTSESYTLPPLFYAIHDPLSDSGAAIRALVYGPASTPAKDLDAQLGDEPFAAWLSEVISSRRAEKDSGPEWMSDYCHNRTADPTRQVDPSAICSVVGFFVRADLVEIWFRTADILVTDGRIEWAPLASPQFEGMTLTHVPETRGLASLPWLLDTPPGSRAFGDISILPDQIVYAPSKTGGSANVTVTVRNIGGQDLHKVSVMVASGVDVNGQATTRQFVVDVPAQQTAELKLQVLFPNGYGFIMAHAMSLTEHSPFGTSTPDPTPADDCALRVINPQLAPWQFNETLLAASGGCTAK